LEAHAATRENFRRPYTFANQTDLPRRGIRKIQKSLIFWPRDSEEMN
jgi:hypothetical protein